MAKKKDPTSKPTSLRLGEDLDKALDEAARSTGLSKSDLARLAIERGLPVLRRQLTQPVEAA